MNNNSTRIDVIFDRYFDKTTKAARIKRGDSSRRVVNPDKQVPKVWGEFLKNTQNKETLFCLLADVITTCPSGIQVIATKHENVLSNVRSEHAISLLQPCDHEEADTRIFLHVLHASQAGHSKIMIRSTDTDVLVIATHLFQQLAVEELWIAFGVAKNLKHIPIHELHYSLRPSLASGLTFLHAFSGCDSTSAFMGIGKTTVYNKAVKAPDTVLVAFKELSTNPATLSEETFAVIESFVVQMYGADSTKDINSTRHQLVARGKTIDRVPPTKESLRQHTKRAAFQAGHVWACSLKTIQNRPPFNEWGWQHSEDGSALIPFWTVLPPKSATCNQLIKCTCKSGCRGRCQCKQKKLPCTALCVCEGKCGGQTVEVLAAVVMDVEPQDDAVACDHDASSVPATMDI